MTEITLCHAATVVGGNNGPNSSENFSLLSSMAFKTHKWVTALKANRIGSKKHETYVLYRRTSRTLPLPWKIFDHKSTAGRLEKQKYVWPTGQTPSEGLSTSQTKFWHLGVLSEEKKYVWRLGRPKAGQEKNLKFYSIFECIKGHYILRFHTFLFESEKSVKFPSNAVFLSSFPSIW